MCLQLYISREIQLIHVGNNHRVGERVGGGGEILGAKQALPNVYILFCLLLLCFS